MDPCRVANSAPGCCLTCLIWFELRVSSDLFVYLLIPMTNASNANDWQLAYQRLRILERFKSGFLARTSHEMRSPINTVISLHQMILEDLCDSPEEERAFLTQSKDTALKMLSLFDRIMAVAKLDVGREPPKLEAVDLSLLLPELDMLTRLQAVNHNVYFTVDDPSDGLAMQSDPAWLKTLLLGLLQDAILNTKTLRLVMTAADGAVVLFVESDRPAADLKHELDAVTEQLAKAEAPSVPSETIDSKVDIPAAETLALSTGLVLATSAIALPPIQGTFSIIPVEETRSRIQLTFQAE